MKKEGEEKTIILNVNSIQKQSIQQQLAMIAFIHLCISLFLNPQIIKAATANYPYTPTDHMLLNCGSPSRQTAADGQSWDGDFGTKLSPDINEASISFAANATEQNPSITGDVPYMTARIFNSQFSYSFPVSRGQKFLRLYFYPVTYSGNTLLKNQSFFSVTANQYSLLSNFSAYLSAQPTLVKEFIINVGQIQLLNVTFVPAANSYAFVNGIEVVSIPDNFYMGNHDVINNPIKLVPMQTPFEGLDKNTTAFESLYYYRLNVGGGAISGVNDTGMFREWFQDREFIFGGNPGNSLSNATITLQYTSQTPNYTAPSLVYTTAMAMGRLSKEYDLSWKFQVDSGFYYIVRLHFCEFMPYLINATGQRRFTILINNRTAELEADIIQWTGGTGIPVFRDYAVFVPNSSYNSQSKQELFLALRPDFANPSIYHDAILNGLEVFKLNSTAGSLAGPNPEPWVPDPKLTEKKKNSKGGHMRMIVGVLGGVTGGCAVLLALYFLLIYRRRQLNNKDFDRKSNSKSSWAPLSTRSRSTKTSASGGSLSLPSDLCRRFLLEEIKSATANFNDAFVIGTGGFGNVYRGYIDNSLTPVAIKRLNPSSRQGAHEFRTEIEMLSNLRHLHLVSLIGYCDEKGEMILVYDYMANGTLRDHLYRTVNPPLPWKQRLRICIGAAKGLHYLHSGAKHNIIHRDVKSTNILLDEKWVAKVSDFGLSKLGPTGGLNSHVSTQVKGSFGYVDPEYYRRQQLTDRSDVYSFGVVLFEVLCARPVVVPNLPRDQLNLAEWARRCYKKGAVDQIVDPNLKGQISAECLRSFSEIAINCLKDQGVDRPAMSDVVWSLEFALQLQEAADKDGEDRPIFIPVISDGGEGEMTSSENDTVAMFTSSDLKMTAAESKSRDQSSSTTASFSTANSCDKLKPESVFSEIRNPKGR